MSYGRCEVSRRLENRIRERAGDYLANRLSRDHRLPREEMPEEERISALREFVDAMIEFLGPEESSAILAEIGNEIEGPDAAWAKDILGSRARRRVVKRL